MGPERRRAVVKQSSLYKHRANEGGQGGESAGEGRARALGLRPVSRVLKRVTSTWAA